MFGRVPLCACCLAIAGPTAAQQATAAAPMLAVPATSDTIRLDGRPTEAAWRHATRIADFHETWPGDNTAPPVRTVVALVHDAQALYIAVWAEDPHAERIRAPYTERDSVSTSNDYVSLTLDTRGDGRAATLVRLTPRGTQADGVLDESQTANGNPVDLAPDFDWQAVTAITDSGWTAEMRLPFASLRFEAGAHQRWGLIVHRVYPRDFAYDFFSVRIPRGSPCFLCHEQTIVLDSVEAGVHVDGDAYVSLQANRTGVADARVSHPQSGFDAEWATTNMAASVTVRPDFSQLPSDVPQLSVNKQFALMYPEQRQFFLEGAELYQTPLPVIYTRSVTEPAWGARTAGQIGNAAYTALVAHDDGGGTVIIPSDTGSIDVPQVFGSTVVVARERSSWTRGFAGLVATDREDAGGGFNRLAGPDFQWHPTAADQLTGELLGSDSRTPNRPDLTSAWDGRRVDALATDLDWHHGDSRFEWFAQYQDIGRNFRADDGFLPQVGVRLVDSWIGASAYGSGAIARFRPWVQYKRIADARGALVSEWRYGALEFFGARGLDLLLRYSDERQRAAGKLLGRRYGLMTLGLAPGQRLAQLNLTARYGGDIDVVSGRTGRGGEVDASLVSNLTRHIEIDALGDLSWLDLPVAGASRRLFAASIARGLISYNLDRQTAIRLIVQREGTDRNPSLYPSPVVGYDAATTVSALLSYRWRWNAAAFIGVGDQRAAGDSAAVTPRTQSAFVKVQLGVH